ncbi:MAG: PstS family phosphate ABC transporter substrate-binding protein [Actinobacteria bacterium]|nr:PstS family phosphate ABC transporter substrate-binding protein [Actinomycetota bacterium]
MRSWRMAAVLAVVALFAAACGNPRDGVSSGRADGANSGDDADRANGGGNGLSGSIEIDGSSTVGPLTDAIAEEYAQQEPDVTVNLSISGSGGGFERFCNVGDTQISNASRPIKQEEADACAENGIEFIEVRVGTDALTMVTNNETDWLECLTTDEIVTFWGPEAADNWSDVNREFPDQDITIFAPGTDSGTYDFFNETVLEPNDIAEPRQDFNASEDDNIIVQGVQGTPGSWGFFGFAYFQQNEDAVRAIAYDAGDGCVQPSMETAQDDSYKLTRPLFIYVKESALDDEHVADFVTFYLDTVNEVIEDVGYIPAPEEVIADAKQKVEEAIASAG